MFAGIETRFLKGYRYVDDTKDITICIREAQAPFEVVQSDDLVLINTKCAMLVFSWQAERYATDDTGRVLI